MNAEKIKTEKRPRIKGDTTYKVQVIRFNGKSVGTICKANDHLIFVIFIGETERVETVYKF